MKFRKKPDIIEAWQFLPQNTADILKLMQTHDNIQFCVFFDGSEPPHVLIDTLEGRMRANEGDWIIKGVQGELYPCKPDIFEQTYEEVT
jgi:hypothetical protein